jgi:formylglycine-generating enzyme required for sulfatase activity
MPQRLRIFISSPADVPDERLRAALIVDKLSQDYSRFFSIEPYRWEHEAMLASAHFQDAIEPPSAFDIVVLILWSRLGTPLPEKTTEREYRGIDGRAPVTGTEWEYEEALKVARERKAPDLLAFRNMSPALIDPGDPNAQAKSMAQLGALNAFWRRHFADRGEFLAAYAEYRTLEEFAQRLEESLRKLIERRIKDVSAVELRAEPIWLGEPFRGLEPYEFEHAPIFFGRDAAVTKAAEQLAANARAGHAFLLVSGASGSGKSSLVKAGVVPRLMKPQRISGMAFLRRTVFRPGAEGTDVFLGLAKALNRAVGQDVGLPELIAPGQDAAQLATHLRGAVGDPGYLLANALGRLTEAGRKSGRLLGFEDAKLILVVDQLEELFTVPGIGPDDRRLFVQVLAGLARSGAVWVIATVRADFWHRAADIPELIALAEGLGRIDLAASSPAELAEIIRKPARAAGLSFEVHSEAGLGLDAILAEDAAAAPGALPLLSFTLDELYKTAKARGATVLTYPSYEALGGLEGAIAKRADEIVAGLPPDAQAALPRVLRALTTVSGVSDLMPVARSAPLEAFAEGSPARTLIDAFIAARLLVAASEGGTAATMRLAHEALFSRWQRARDQLAADRRDLEKRMLVERQFGRWSQARGRARGLLLLRNPDLANAVDLARRWGDELDPAMRDFIKRSSRRARLAQTLTAGAAVGVIVGLLGWINQSAIADQWRWWWTYRPFLATNMWPYVLKSAAEQALKPGDSFRECAPRQQDRDYCPDMVVVPAGSFQMGSPQTDNNASTNEFPQHQVTIAKQFAVSKFELTFAEWNACIAGGGCSGYRPSNAGFGLGEQPVIYVNWDDAQQYVTWLSKMTGKPYRLLSEAEYEYSTRAGTTTKYPWGDDIGKNNTNCKGCGSQWDGKQTAPVGSFEANGFVGSFAANAFGLYDMVGNEWEWTQDCYNDSYTGAPADGSAWVSSDCGRRVLRGGSWGRPPASLRSASRDWDSTGVRDIFLGFRLGRTLLTP